MQLAFVHRAVLRPAPGGNPGAPGAAVTVALCGHWEHPPPCPLAAHHTAADAREDGTLLVRVVFVCAADAETEVRARIGDALAAGGAPGPDGGRTDWELLDHGPDALRPEESERARRLRDG